LTLQPALVSACWYSAPTMNSSVKFLVPRVIVPPLDADVVPDDDELVAGGADDVVPAGADDDDELELLLEPHAATASAATRASMSAATVGWRRPGGDVARRGVDADMVFLLWCCDSRQLINWPSYTGPGLPPAATMSSDLERRPPVRSGNGVTPNCTSASRPSMANVTTVIVRAPAITPPVP
jgi:hypothetical protein